MCVCGQVVSQECGLMCAGGYYRLNTMPEMHKNNDCSHLSHLLL